jgi:signal transduction histidine kinase/CheY-like chemotaxis protein
LRLLLAAALLVPVALMAGAAWYSHQARMSEARVEIERTADVMREHAEKVFDSIELISAAMRELIGEMSAAEVRANEIRLNRAFRQLVEGRDQFFSISVIGADGFPLVGATTVPVQQLDFSDRDYFIALRDDPSRREFVSRFLRSRVNANDTFFIVSTPLRYGAEFGGVFAVSLRPTYFTDVYARFAGDSDMIAGLVRSDGSLLAIHPFADVPLDDVPPVQSFADLIAGQPDGVVTATGEDGSRTMVAFRRIGAHDAYVAVGLPLAAVTQDWMGTVWWGLGIGIPVTIALFLLALVALRRAQRESVALAELRSESALRQSAEERLRQAAKMEAVGQLSGGIAHDFNNLLTAIGGNVELLARRLGTANPDYTRYVEHAREGVKRAASLTQRLLAFSRRQALQPSEIDPNRLISGMSDLLHRTLGEHIDVEVVLGSGVWRTFADPNQLENAILNLAINSRDAMPDGGRLTIETANSHIDDGYIAREGLSDIKAGQYVLVAVSDTGKGMPREVAERAFEPFFTTKPAGEGTGLGLSMVYGFVKQSGGHAKIYTEAGQGTTVKLYLPRSTAEADASARAAAEPKAAPGGGETILVVEDDAGVLAFEVETLTAAGYSVIEARTGAEALARIAEGATPDLLFTDVVLAGGMNGREVADRVKAARPAVKVLFATGYTQNAIVHHGRLDEGVQLISKPFSTNDLLNRIAKVLREERR